MRTNPLLLWALFVAIQEFAWAQPVEGFHIVDGAISAGRRLQFTPQLRLRSSDRFRDLAQVRAGLVATHLIGKGFDAILAGYYEPTVRQPQFLGSYRIQAGGQVRLAVSRKLVVQPRLLWERLNRTTGFAYRRVRIGGRVSWNSNKISPYLYNDTFFTRNSAADAGLFHSSRSGAGVTWFAREKVRLEFEYFFDARRVFWGGNRQVVTTRIQFR